MVEKIIWTKEATTSFFNACEYLLATCTIREVEHFEELVKKKSN
jgi:hypothetical protein